MQYKTLFLLRTKKMDGEGVYLDSIRYSFLVAKQLKKLLMSVRAVQLAISDYSNLHMFSLMFTHASPHVYTHVYRHVETHVYTCLQT